MARRKAKRKGSRRAKYKGAINVTNLALGLVALTATTKAFVGTTPLQFLLGGYVDQYSAGGGSPNYITLKEIIAGGNFGSGGSVVENIPEKIGENFKQNVFPLFMTLAGVKVARKLITATGAARVANKNIRMLGMGNLVKF